MGGQEKLHNHMAQGYIYQMQIWNVQIIVNYICFITGINMWHKLINTIHHATQQMATVIRDMSFHYFPVFPNISRYFPVFPGKYQYFPPSREILLFPGYLTTLSSQWRIQDSHEQVLSLLVDDF